MRIRPSRWIWVPVLLCATAATVAAFTITIPNLFPFLDPTGFVSTYSSTGSFSENNAFFQNLGTNGRTCASCHVVGNAMGLSAVQAQFVYAISHGTDPLFSTVDGAVCPTTAPGQAPNFSLLLQNGLIRIGLTMPSNPEFTINVVQDPYGCALTTNPSTGVQTISVYRRPLPATNLGFLSSVMFDGRETVEPLNNPSTYQANLVTDLAHQAMDATLIHAQATNPPSAAQQAQIVNFELALNSAQAFDFQAGLLNFNGANGGAQFLSTAPFYPGINDSLGPPSGFTPNVFTLYSNWASSPYPGEQSVARGEAIFNTQPLVITDVRGLNDALNEPTINGTCTTCHDTPNVGDHSLAVPLEIGTSRTVNYETDPTIQAAVSQLSMPNLPVFAVTCNEGPDAGEVTYTSDPGKALLTGLCTDVGRGKGLILRGLAARAPYFHNGAAANLNEVVDFYNVRFQMNLTQQQKTDLANFLKTL
jgi:cytochrome c peroxidase